MSRVTELENEIKELENKRTELQKELEIEKQKELGFPFEHGDKYFLLTDAGNVVDGLWQNYAFDHDALSQGNVFKFKQEAKKERDRRALLTRFRQFRDQCNGDWKPDFKDSSKDKYIIYYDYEFRKFYCCNLGGEDEFHLFGYFKIRKDCERAIELFGDEIKRLFLEVE